MTENTQIAIVVVAYNRPESLKRILASLANADYSGFENVPLVISIDKSTNDDVKTVAGSFEWMHGDKKIIAYPENLGLKKHIISCGDLTAEYENVIVLEDDLFVSPYFYEYVNQALQFYKDDDQIAGISLYSYDYNELIKQPFVAVDDGADNYFMQVPSSWGQLWTRKQWSGFMQFYNSTEAITAQDNIPAAVIGWPDSSWKKYFFNYLSAANKFFVYPRISYTTNFGDTGTHFTKAVNTFQVKLAMAKRKMSFSKFDAAFSKYDAYHELLPEVLKKFNPALAAYDFECDLNGSKENQKIKKKYLLSVKECSAPVMSFSGAMIPAEMNILSGQSGAYFHLAETAEFSTFDPAKAVNSAFYDKINLNQFRLAVYKSAEKNMTQTFSYKLGSSLLMPFKFIKKLLKR